MIDHDVVAVAAAVVACPGDLAAVCRNYRLTVVAAACDIDALVHSAPAPLKEAGNAVGVGERPDKLSGALARNGIFLLALLAAADKLLGHRLLLELGADYVRALKCAVDVYKADVDLFSALFTLGDDLLVIAVLVLVVGDVGFVVDVDIVRPVCFESDAEVALGFLHQLCSCHDIAVVESVSFNLDVVDVLGRSGVVVSGAVVNKVLSESIVKLVALVGGADKLAVYIERRENVVDEHIGGVEGVDSLV